MCKASTFPASRQRIFSRLGFGLGLVFNRIYLFGVRCRDLLLPSVVIAPASVGRNCGLGFSVKVLSLDLGTVDLSVFLLLLPFSFYFRGLSN